MEYVKVQTIVLQGGVTVTTTVFTPPVKVVVPPFPGKPLYYAGSTSPNQRLTVPGTKNSYLYSLTTS